MRRLTLCEASTSETRNPQTTTPRECYSGLGLEPSTSRTADWRSTNCSLVQYSASENIKFNIAYQKALISCAKSNASVGSMLLVFLMFIS